MFPKNNQHVKYNQQFLSLSESTMEPHIAAIMARLDARQGQGTDTASSITQTTQGSAAPKPPLSYEEFMTAEKLVRKL